MSNDDERDSAEEAAQRRSSRDENMSELAGERFQAEGITFRGCHLLRSDTESDDGSWESIRAKLFGHLWPLAAGTVKRYSSDLYHDARWLRDHVTGQLTFFYGVRDAGTSIGTHRAHVEAIQCDALYRVDLIQAPWHAGTYYVALGQVY